MRRQPSSDVTAQCCRSGENVKSVTAARSAPSPSGLCTFSGHSPMADWIRGRSTALAVGRRSRDDNVIGEIGVVGRLLVADRRAKMRHGGPIRRRRRWIGREDGVFAIERPDDNRAVLMRRQELTDRPRRPSYRRDACRNDAARLVQPRVLAEDAAQSVLHLCRRAHGSRWTMSPVAKPIRTSSRSV